MTELYTAVLFAFEDISTCILYCIMYISNAILQRLCYNVLSYYINSNLSLSNTSLMIKLSVIMQC